MPRVFHWTAEKGIREGASDAVPFAVTEAIPQLDDAPGLIVLPPLWDHHGHVAAYGTALEQVDLRTCVSAGAALARIDAAASTGAPTEWLEGFGWDQNRWTEGYPDRRDLDGILPRRPALLRRIDGHAGWLNTEALRRAGFDDGSPDPPGGRLIRENGRLTGIVLDAALSAVEACIPAPDEPTLRRRILRALHNLKDSGLAGVTDMGLEPRHVEILAALDDENALPISVEGFLWVRHGGRPSGGVHRGRQFLLRGAKFFADGALGSRGAALRQDYADEPGNRGLLLWDTGRLAEALSEAVSLGLTPAVHAIGDRAAAQVLDAVEASRLPSGVRIEHVQIARPEDVERMRRLGVVASIQPCHYLSDRAWAPVRLGEAMSDAYRWGSLCRRGIPILLGTDFPIEPPDPARTIAACLERDDPAERLSLRDVLRAYAPPRGLSVRAGATVAAFDPVEAAHEPERLRLARCISVGMGGRVP